MNRNTSLAALGLSLIASTALAQTRPREAPAGTERPATARPRAFSSGQAAPAAEDARRTNARTPAGGARQNRPGGAQAALLESFGDWTAYATPPGRGRICYALSQPTERSPKNFSRDDAYLFVSVRPSENVRNEVALMMGFPVKEPAADAASAEEPAAASKPAPDQQLLVGAARFAIAGKEENAWLADPAQEGQLIAVMAKGQKLLVRAVSKRGSSTTDAYSLKGFDDALRKAREECR